MKIDRKEPAPKGALEIIEEAFHLVRTSSIHALALYCLGTVPFVLGLLYFWGDMSRSAFAYRYAARGAFLMTLLFVWMKCCHAMYARRLLEHVCNSAPQRWTFRMIARAIIRQTIVQSTGFFILPLAFLAAVPFGWAYALYQNMTVLEDGKGVEIIDLYKKADRLARPWQKQNFLVIWALSPFLLISAAAFFLVVSPIIVAVSAAWSQVFLSLYMGVLLLALVPLSPFGVLIAANIASAILLFPGLFQMLTGISTRFTLTFGGMFNTTFFAAVCGLTFLCMDPLAKAAYVLRCFYLDSQKTGEDLRVDLKWISRKAAAVGLVAICVLNSGLAVPREARAQDRTQHEVDTRRLTISPSDLDQALDRELESRFYVWRMPREKPAEKEGGATASFFRHIAETLADWGEAIMRRAQPLTRWIEALIDWLSKRAPEFDRDRRGLETISGVLRTILYGLAILLFVVVGVMIWRMWKNRFRQPLQVDAIVVRARPDIEKETTSAAELPEDGWLALAAELLEQGEFRLALRAVFLATLALLARANFIYIALFKSNRDYKRELERRAHAYPELIDVFSQSATVYESIWYGDYEARRDLVEYLLANQQKLKTYEGAN
ncbi:MAG: hypothetical protein C4520_04245 [Candidatus Abyssobacteria bacterium SURF_5]|uniref:DUF4129 domain-containing protein n=1 Tax=Abyssobacteria bacterium (strain SURF_5) TaxID=2093360 RepID=A0A3A4P4N1_ABYX5|nr:MAG: hypothetical protein C4520_04245 [Candidatus Abyssubacteria bacterium SURF_5]